MPNHATNADLLKLCAEKLTQEGLVPFTRRDLIGRVQKIDPTRLDQSLNPTLQGMTVNLQGGPTGSLKNVFYSVGRGLFELYDPAKHGGPGAREQAVTTPLPQRPSTPPITRKPVSDPIEVRSLRLDSQVAAREFAYHGETAISEDEVKNAVHSALRAEGWTTHVKWGYEHGIDIEAARNSQRLVLEAKGEGSLNPMRVNYFVGALGELMQRMDSGDCRYGLALPAHRQFVNLALGLPTWVRERLNICFYFVRPAGEGVYEIGVLEQGPAQ